MPPDAGADVQATAQRAAEAFARAVQARPADAAAAAAEHHMSPLAPFVVGANGVEPDLEHAAFNLQEGAFSEAIRTRVGFTVLRVVERVPPRPMNEDLLRARVRLALENRKLQRAREDLVDALRARARIQIFVDL